MGSLLNESLVKEYEAYFTARRAEKLKYWDFYFGDQGEYLPKFKGETYQEWVERSANAVIENHCKPTVNIAAGYLYGISESISRRCEDEEAHRWMNDRIWEDNCMPEFLLDAAIMAGATGAAPVYLRWVDSRTMQPFEIPSQKLSIEYGTVEYILLDSVDTLPIPLFDNPRRLRAILRCYDREEGSGLALYDRLQRREYKNLQIIEYIDDNIWQRYEETGTNTDEYEQKIGISNPYGDINTMFVLLSNPGDPMLLEGDPDHKDAIPLNIDLNERLSDDRNTISHHSFPIIVSEAEIPEFVRKPNSILLMDGQNGVNGIKYLTWDNVLEASQISEKNHRKNIPIVTGISDVSRGNAADIGQVRSGAGLRMLFQSDIVLVRRKQKKALKFEKSLISSTLKMIEYHTGIKFKSRSSTVIFPEDFVGLDELLKAQVEQIRLQSKTVSLRDIIKNDYPDLSESEIEDKIKEIEKYSKVVEPQSLTPPQTSREKSMEQDD